MISKPSDLVADVAAAAGDLVRDYVVPIYTSDEAADPDHVGTGVLLRVGSHHLLISAAHVFDYTAKGGVHLLLRGRERTPIFGTPWTTALGPGGTRETDRIDLGVAEFTDDEVKAIGPERFLSSRDLAPKEAHAKPATYLAVGFPNKLNEASLTSRTVPNFVVRFSTIQAASRAYELCKFVNDSHLLIKYDPRRVAVAGKVGGVPHLRGISGGGVWRINPLSTYTADNRPKLVALIIERPQCFGRALLCTRIELVRAVIRAALPDVEEEIRPIPELKVSVRLGGAG